MKGVLVAAMNEVSSEPLANGHAQENREQEVISLSSGKSDSDSEEGVGNSYQKPMEDTRQSMLFTPTTSYLNSGTERSNDRLQNIEDTGANPNENLDGDHDEIPGDTEEPSFRMSPDEDDDDDADSLFFTSRPKIIGRAETTEHMDYSKTVPLKRAEKDLRRGLKAADKKKSIQIMSEAEERRAGMQRREAEAKLRSGEVPHIGNGARRKNKTAATTQAKRQAPSSRSRPRQAATETPESPNPFYLGSSEEATTQAPPTRPRSDDWVAINPPGSPNPFYLGRTEETVKPGRLPRYGPAVEEVVYIKAVSGKLNAAETKENKRRAAFRHSEKKRREEAEAKILTFKPKTYQSALAGYPADSENADAASTAGLPSIRIPQPVRRAATEKPKQTPAPTTKPKAAPKQSHMPKARAEAARSISRLAATPNSFTTTPPTSFTSQNNTPSTNTSFSSVASSRLPQKPLVKPLVPSSAADNGDFEEEDRPERPKMGLGLLEPKNKNPPAADRLDDNYRFELVSFGSEQRRAWTGQTAEEMRLSEEERKEAERREKRRKEADTRREIAEMKEESRGLELEAQLQRVIALGKQKPSALPPSVLEDIEGQKLLRKIPASELNADTRLEVLNNDDDDDDDSIASEEGETPEEFAKRQAAIVEDKKKRVDRRQSSEHGKQSNSEPETLKRRYDERGSPPPQESESLDPRIRARQQRASNQDRPHEKFNVQRPQGRMESLPPRYEKGTAAERPLVDKAANAASAENHPNTSDAKRASPPTPSHVVSTYPQPVERPKDNFFIPETPPPTDEVPELLPEEEQPFEPRSSSEAASIAAENAEETRNGYLSLEEGSRICSSTASETTSEASLHTLEEDNHTPPPTLPSHPPAGWIENPLYRVHCYIASLSEASPLEETSEILGPYSSLVMAVEAARTCLRLAKGVINSANDFTSVSNYYFSESTSYDDDLPTFTFYNNDVNILASVKRTIQWVPPAEEEERSEDGLAYYEVMQRTETANRVEVVSRHNDVSLRVANQKAEHIWEVICSQMGQLIDTFIDHGGGGDQSQKVDKGQERLAEEMDWQPSKEYNTTNARNPHSPHPRPSADVITPQVLMRDIQLPEETLELFHRRGTFELEYSPMPEEPEPTSGWMPPQERIATQDKLTRRQKIIVWVEKKVLRGLHAPAIDE